MILPSDRQIITTLQGRKRYIMSNLKHLDMMSLDDIFEMGSGYVLDFSDRTIAIFFTEELGIDFDDPKFMVNGTSKAKRLRCLLQTVNASTAVRVLRALWDYREAITLPLAGNMPPGPSRRIGKCSSKPMPRRSKVALA